MPGLQATGVHYIKLGRGGQWEADAIEQGLLRFGYHELPHELCMRGQWNEAREALRAYRGGDERVLTSDIKQAKIFYTAPETAIFVTFYAGRLWWCRPTGPAEILEDQSKSRGTVDGWRSKSEAGVELTTDRLSGQLLAVQGFRGTICKVKAQDYLLRKLGDELLPQVETAVEAEERMVTAIHGLLELLTWQDFELLVDLVFSSSGWKRTGKTGGTQKTVDIELVLPSTRERAFVQVKSRTTPQELHDYIGRMAEMEGISRMFFVWHTGSVGEAPDLGRVTLVGPQSLARMVFDAGLSSWLREKVS